MVPNLENSLSNDLGAKFGLKGLITPRTSANAAVSGVPANDHGENTRSLPGMGWQEGKAVANNPTREETREIINDKLAAVEARLETKLIGIDSKIDRLADTIGHVGAQMAEVKEDNKSTRWTIVTTVIIASIAVMAVIITVQIGLLTAFSAGAVAPKPPAASSH